MAKESKMIEKRKEDTKKCQEKVKQTIRKMKREEEAINFGSVSRKSGVSESFLRKNVEMSELVKANRTTTYTAHRNTTPRTSAKTMLEAVRKQNLELANENEMLRAENAKLLKENEKLGELQGEVNKWKTNYSALLSAMQATDNDIEEFNRTTDNLHNIRS